MFGPIKIRTLLTAALLTSILGVTGCGRRMLKNYSSLAPKTASLEQFDSTIRSQNEPPDNQLPGTTGWSGYSSFPKARLLQPQFGESNAADSQQASQSTAAKPIERSVEQPTGGHSLGFTASQIRQRMNERNNGSNPVELLPEKPELWQVLSSQSSSPNPTNSPATTDATRSISLPATSGQPLNPGTGFEFSNEFAPAGSLVEADTLNTIIDSPTSPDVSPAVERSVLDRLKGLYDDSESNAKQLFKRNLQRLPNPWNVFRDKQEQAIDEPADPVLPPFETELYVDNRAAENPQNSNVADALIAAVESELQDWPVTLSGQPQKLESYQRRQQDLRLLQLIAGRPEEAIASIEGMPGPEQEFWQELMLALAHFRSDDQPNREERLTITASQLRSAIGHISMEAALRFRRLEVCSRINSFGRIETFPSNEFDPGQPLLLYVELENVGTELTSRGTQRTNFDAQIQFLHHDSDDPIETIELAEIHDETTSARTDYFQSFELNIPSHLAPGRYKIRLQLRDVVRRKQADGFVEFQVREPASGT